MHRVNFSITMCLNVYICFCEWGFISIYSVSCYYLYLCHWMCLCVISFMNVYVLWVWVCVELCSYMFVSECVWVSVCMSYYEHACACMCVFANDCGKEFLAFGGKAFYIFPIFCLHFILEFYAFFKLFSNFSQGKDYKLKEFAKSFLRDYLKSNVLYAEHAFFTHHRNKEIAF